MTDPSDLIRNAILQTNQRLEQTFTSGNVRAVSSFYTDDAMLLPTGSEPIQGAAAIADFWEMVLQMGIQEVKIETREIDARGDTAIEMGEYKLSGAGGQLLDRGKYVVIWKLIRSEWKLHRDIWNSSIARQS